MKGRVFAMMPEHWKDLLPVELHKWIGQPLLLLKALYGYNFSGKLLYEEQAEFLEKYGMRHTTLIALWKKSLPNGKILLVLQYSGNFLAACDNSQGLEDFKTAIGKCFNIEIKARADWYLQARLRQDAGGNIVLDQQRYSKSIVQRYLPNSPMYRPLKTWPDTDHHCHTLLNGQKKTTAKKKMKSKPLKMNIV
jgi:hypothetical protein